MADTFALDAEPCQLSDVAGFRAGAAACGLKPEGPDVGILLCEAADGVGTAILTQNAVRAAPVLVSGPPAASGRLRAAVVNAGNANSCTGEDGRRDAQEMIALAASGLDLPQELVLVASNGCAGRPLPMEQVHKGIEDACRDARESGGGDFAGALVAPGAHCGRASGSGTIDGKAFRVAGTARGAGDTAQMFAFLVTDAAVGPECLREIAISAIDRTFGNLVEGGAGTNDTFCVLASGLAGNEIIDNVFSAGVLSEALEAVAKELVVGAASGKGPVEVRVSGGASPQGATAAARAIAGSIRMTGLGTPEHSTALVLAAAGRSGKRIEDARTTVRLAGETVYEGDQLVHPLPEGLEKKLQGPRVTVEVDLGLGSDSAVAWTHCGATAGKEQVEAAKNAAEEARAAAESLAARLRDAEKERESLLGRLEEEGSAHKAAEHETQAIRERLEATEKEKETASAAAESARREMELKLSESESTRTAAAGEAEELRKDLGLAREAAAKEARDSAERIGSAEKADAAARAECDSLRAKIEESASARAASAREAEEVHRELEQAREGAGALAESRREELNAKVKEAEAAEAERKALAEKLGRLEREVEEADAARATAVREADELRDRGKKAEVASKEKDERIDAADRAVKEADTRAAAEREDIEAKLKEAGSARDAALRETEEMRGRLELAERPVDKKAEKRAAKEAKAAAKADRKELKALTADLWKKDAKIAELRAGAERAKAAEGDAERYRKEAEEASARLEAVKSEAEQVKTQFSLKEQLLKQFMDEEQENRKLAEEHKRLLGEFKELQEKAQADAGL